MTRFSPEAIHNRIQALKQLRVSRLNQCHQLQQELATLAQQRDLIASRIHDLKTKDPNLMEPVQLLQQAPPAMREAMAAILAEKSESPYELMQKFLDAGRGFWSKLFNGKAPTYLEILGETCAFLKISAAESVCARETAITLHLFNEHWRKMSPEDQQIFREKIEAGARQAGLSLKDFNASILTASGILAAQASGFGVYLAASTLVGAVTHAFGITLPFVFFSSMSSIISWLIGPAGWAITIGLLLPKLFGPDYQKMVKVILLITAMRTEKLGLWQDELNALTTEHSQICAASLTKQQLQRNYYDQISSLDNRIPILHLMRPAYLILNWIEQAYEYLREMLKQ